MIAVLALACVSLVSGQLGTIILDGGGRIYLLELCAVAYLALVVMKIRTRPGLWGGLVFLGCMTGSFLLSLGLHPIDQSMIAGLYLARLWFWTSFLIVVLSPSYRSLQPDAAVVNRLALWTTAGLILLGGIQLLVMPDLAVLRPDGWDPHRYRLVGTFLEPAFLAAVLGISLIGIWYQHQRENGSQTLLMRVVIGLAILLTASRAAVGALLVTGIASLLRQKAYRMVLFGMGILIIIAGLIPFLPRPDGEGWNLLRTSTIQSRIVDASEAVEIWQQSPIWGVGYNQIGAFRDREDKTLFDRDHAAHSFHASYLIVLVTGGVIGLGAWGCFLWQMVRLGGILPALLLFLGLFALVDNVLLHPLVIFWIGLWWLATTPRPQSRPSPV